MKRLRVVRHIQSIYVYLGVACALVGAVVAFAAYVEAGQQDQAALETQRAIARYETVDAYLTLSGRLAAEAHADAVYENVVLAWDEAWIAREYEPRAGRDEAFSVAIVAPDGAVRFLAAHGGALFNSRDLNPAPGWSALIAAAQKEPASLAPKTRHGIVLIAGKPYFAAAAAVTPSDRGNAPIAEDRRFTLVFFKPASADYFYALTAGFKAKDVRIVTHDVAADGQVVLPLTDAAGVPRAFLHWRPPTPGSHFFDRLLPVLLIMLLVLAVGLTIAVTRWNAAQKKFHEARSKAVAAQEESRVKSMFLGNISHELRTPLNAIIGFAEMLQMQIFGPLGAKKYEEYAADILASGRAMLKMVNDLIEIARIRAGDTAREREAFDAMVCLNRAIAESHPEAEKKNVSVAVQSGMAGTWCVGSEISLKAALHRLIDNAVAASAPGHGVDVLLAQRDGHIVIDIVDCASPIPDEVLKRANGDLFIFSGDHLETHESAVGTNFEIAKGLVTLMGGTLLLESVGQGNRARIRLPPADAPVRKGAPVAA